MVKKKKYFIITEGQKVIQTTRIPRFPFKVVIQQVLLLHSLLKHLPLLSLCRVITHERENASIFMTILTRVDSVYYGLYGCADLLTSLL